MRSSIALVCSCALACAPTSVVTLEPVAAAAPTPTSADAHPEPPPPPPPKVPADAFAIGTFDLDWAIDAADVPRPAAAREHRAKSDGDWAWKRDGLARVIAEERLDVVALQELGGERELDDLARAIEQAGGHRYTQVFVASEDATTGLHVGLLSRFPVANERRLDAPVAKQMAVDVELPSGTITVVVVHARGGMHGAAVADRRKQARGLKRAIAPIAGEHPVVVLGALGEPYTPSFPQYAASSVGILVGAGTKTTADDCQDSGAHIGETTVTDTPEHRILSCGLWLRSATAAGRARIVRGATDPPDARWTDVPIDGAPERDLGKHLLVWAEILRP